MPITKGAKKAIRVSARKRVFNLARIDAMKKKLKELRILVSEKKAKEAQALLPAVYKAIDKAAKRGVIKKNTAARRKARAARMIKKIST